MNNVGINTSAYANVVTPFSPVGKQAVGLENAEAREEVFSPVEEPSSSTAAADDKRDTRGSTETAQQAQEEEKKVEERKEQQQQRDDRQQIEELAARDREVRAHEQAHAAVGGQYAGSPNYTYQRGPDGVNYAIGGEVPISLPSGGGDPQQTLAAAEQVQRAALAPADPSPQDRRVAAAAASTAQEARQQISEQRFEEQRTEGQDEAEKQGDVETDEQVKADDQKQADSREQRLNELNERARRNTQLGEQLVTLDNIQKGRALGSVFDQRV